MKLTARLLRKLVESEKQEMMQEMMLRKNIRRHLLNIFEAGPVKPGSETAGDAAGDLETKKLADAVGADPSKLKTAVADVQKGKRSSTDNAVLGDLFAKLVKASPEDTVKAMNVLKKVSSEDESGDKK